MQLCAVEACCGRHGSVLEGLAAASMLIYSDVNISPGSIVRREGAACSIPTVLSPVLLLRQNEGKWVSDIRRTCDGDIYGARLLLAPAHAPGIETAPAVSLKRALSVLCSMRPVITPLLIRCFCLVHTHTFCRLKSGFDRYLRGLTKKQSNLGAWLGFFVLSLLVWKLVSDGDFSFIMVSLSAEISRD